MKRIQSIFALLTSALFLLVCTASLPAAGPVIHLLLGEKPQPIELRAAELLTTQLQKLFDADVKRVEVAAGQANLIILGAPLSNRHVQAALAGQPELGLQDLVIRTIKIQGKSALLVAGGTTKTVFWSASELGERLGVRYLLTGDAYPPVKPAFTIEGYDVKLRPASDVRGFATLGTSPLGLAAWGLADQQALIAQLAKLKFNQLVIRVSPEQPFLPADLRPKGVTPALFPGYKFVIDGDTPGRKAFRGARAFTNPDLADKLTTAELCAAGVTLVQGLIQAAHDWGMHAVLQVDTPGLSAADTQELVKKYIRTYPTADAVCDFSVSGLPADSKLKATAPAGTHGPTATRQLTPCHYVEWECRDIVLPLSIEGHMLKPFKSMPEAGVAGFVAYCQFTGDLDPILRHLSRQGYGETPTPAETYDQLYTPVGGRRDVAERLTLAYEFTSQALGKLQGIDQSPLKLQPGALTKVLDAGQPLPWAKELLDLYTKSNHEMHRAYGNCDAVARPVLFYYTKRDEFAISYLTCLVALADAGVAKANGKDEMYTENLEKAVESLYNALNSLSDVARDQSDRGLIAALTEFGYRPLMKRLE